MPYYTILILLSTVHKAYRSAVHLFVVQLIHNKSTTNPQQIHNNQQVVQVQLVVDLLYNKSVYWSLGLYSSRMDEPS